MIETRQPELRDLLRNIPTPGPPLVERRGTLVHVDDTGIFDMEWRRRDRWGCRLGSGLGRKELEGTSALRQSTYAGRPFGNESFVSEMSAIPAAFGTWRAKEQPVAANSAGKPGYHSVVF